MAELTFKQLAAARYASQKAHREPVPIFYGPTEAEQLKRAGAWNDKTMAIMQKLEASGGKD